MSTNPRKPSWDQLYETAGAQEGYFTTKQAADAGYSPQLLAKHLRARRIARVQRGIYRLVHFPAGDHEDLVIAWLWSEQSVVISHQTALFLHELSDALSEQIHLSVPTEWKERQLRVPRGVTLHYANVPSRQRTWVGAVPATSVARTLNDCARSGMSPELLRQGAAQALRRGLATTDELSDVAEARAGNPTRDFRNRGGRTQTGDVPDGRAFKLRFCFPQDGGRP